MSVGNEDTSSCVRVQLLPQAREGGVGVHGLKHVATVFNGESSDYCMAAVSPRWLVGEMTGFGDSDKDFSQSV